MNEECFQESLNVMEAPEAQCQSLDGVMQYWSSTRHITTKEQACGGKDRRAPPVDPGEEIEERIDQKRTQILPEKHGRVTNLTRLGQKCERVRCAYLWA